MSDTTSRVCVHGSLRRQCEVCDLTEQRDAALAERDAAQEELSRTQDRADGYRAEIDILLHGRAEHVAYIERLTAERDAAFTTRERALRDAVGKGGQHVESSRGIQTRPVCLDPDTIRLMTGDAAFDATRRYRYWLSREWLYGDGTCVFVMLNPSTADESVLDPTVTRCVRYAQRWGFARLEVLNIFAWRSTDPRVLTDLADPVGPENMQWIDRQARAAGRVVCAWGRWGRVRGQGRAVQRLLHDVDLWCLGTNADGSPVHPLYQPNDAQLERLKDG